MTHNLFHQFGMAALLLLLCVALHGFGLFRLQHALRGEAYVERVERTAPLSLRGTFFTLSIVLLLVVLHGIEIWFYAMAYLVIGAQPTIEQALYVSTITYTTVGYSDVLIGTDWRLLTAFESIVGVILLGWSTAFFFRMLGRFDPH